MALQEEQRRTTDEVCSLVERVQIIRQSAEPHIRAIEQLEVDLAREITVTARQIQEEAEKRTGPDYLSLSLDKMQQALSQPPLNETNTGKLVTDIMLVHRHNAGEQTEILLSPPRIFESESEEDPHTSFKLVLHNNFGASPQGQLAEGGLLIEFELSFTPDGIERLNMQLNQRRSIANDALRSHFENFSNLDQLTVMWLFMDTTYQAVTAIPILDQQTSDDL